MKMTRTAIPDVLMLEPTVFADDRGFFVETFSERDFASATGIAERFVQDNHSRSKKGVLRGLHYQLPPHAQGKLVRVSRGTVFDVAVDLRRGSSTFGRWIGLELSESNHLQMWIPSGFAHGFAVISDTAEVQYKTTDYYAPECDACVRWDDPQLDIDWPDVDTPWELSAKDRAAPGLVDAPTFG